MDITQIEILVAAAATAKGYSAQIASSQEIEGMIEVMPTAWIGLPTVLWVEGRDEGMIGHQVVVTLMDDYKRFNFNEQLARVNQMQEDILEIMTQISTNDGIVEVQNLTLTPRMIPTTHHDNIGCICSATIVSYF